MSVTLFSAGKEQKERIVFFDNLKAILIVLVFFGHLIQYFAKDNEWLRLIYTYLYFFHMPVFVYVSGFFSKKSAKGDILKLLPILFLYLFFQFLYTGAYAFGTPFWILWFLMSLLIWRLILPYFTRLKHPVIWAFLIALTVGFLDNIGYFLSLSRAAYFFPFFLLGYYTSLHTIQKWMESRRRYFWLILLPLTFALWVYVNSRVTVDYHALYGSYPYSALGLTFLPGLLLRSAFYLIAVLFIFIFLKVTPAAKKAYANIGKNSLSIYLLHGFVVLFLNETLFRALSAGSTIIIIVISAILSLLFSFLFALPFFENALSYIKYPQKFFEKNSLYTDNL